MRGIEKGIAKGVTYTSIAILLMLFGVVFIAFVNQTSQQSSYTRLQFEYETLKAQLGIEPELLNKMLYATSVVGRLSFLEAFESGDVTYMFVRNTGDVPLSGFAMESGGFSTEPVIRPDLLLPGSEGVIAVYTSSIEKPGQLSIKTKQNVAVHINFV